MSAPEILPICTTAAGRGGLVIKGQWHVPIYCMNCWRHHGYCNESATDPGGGYVGYLCDPCAETWSPLVGASLVPDAVHWQRVRDAELEDYGRALTALEQAQELDDVNSPLAKVARSR